MSVSVVMDTNALMMPVECGCRVFEELDRLLGAPEAIVPTAVVDELDRLSAGAGEAATAASVGRDLVDRCRVIDHAAESADDAVLECARRAEVTHAVTNDAPLRDRLLDAGVPVVSLRGEAKLAITQP